MSLSNDDGDDGLAALFGGVTPQKAPRPDADVRPAREPVAPPVAPQGAQPVAYPGLEPAAQVTPPQFVPSAPAGGGYDIPAPTFGQQTAQPPTPPQAAPRSYDLPAPGESTYPGLNPVSAPQPAALPPTAPPQTAPTQNVPQQTVPQQYTPPPFDSVQYAPPSPNVGYPPTAQYPAESPVAEPAAYQPPRYPGLDPTTAYAPPPVDPAYSQFAAPSQAAPSLTEPPVLSSYDAPVPVQSEYPPAGSTPSYPPPSFDPPAYQPPPLNAPTFDAPTYDAPVFDAPTYAAPTFDAPAFDAQAYGAPASQVYEPPAYTPSSAVPESSGVPEPPVRAELPNTPAVFQPPAGPLLPSSSAAIETPEDLGRSTVGEKVGVAVAILTGPIGLIVAIASAIRSARRRGWVIGIVRASLVLGVISTLLVGAAGYVVWNLQAAALEHARLAAASADFCAAAATDPAIVQAPLLGWPSPGKTIQESLDDMTTWTTRWTDLATKSPKALADDLTLVASKGQQIIDSVTTARTIDNAGNQAVIGSVVSATGIPAWYQSYCVTP